VATTGAWPKKSDTPYVPTQPQEIAEEVYACWKAGAAIAHIHVREEDESPAMKFEAFKKTVELIREKKDCDIVLNLTTSGSVDPNLTLEDRTKHLKYLKPEMCSYDAGSMNWMHSTVFLNPPPFLEGLAKFTLENNIKPELEIFDTGMLYNSLYYGNKGLIKAPMHFQLCLGAPGGMTATIENFMHLKSQLPEGSTFSAFGIGAQHLTIMYMTVITGGHVRVGMEDNVYLSKGVLAKSNVDFVEKAKKVIGEFGREVATPAEARRILQLRTK
ncbi:MAG: 3-keto-5-aminohexanoate cleavage protein, partial [Syntrophaceae bacterium]|nr:3-keto-5-aminohexanoate cleavage protein [Syntrophaceae bacterium]